MNLAKARAASSRSRAPSKNSATVTIDTHSLRPASRGSIANAGPSRRIRVSRSSAIRNDESKRTGGRLSTTGVPKALAPLFADKCRQVLAGLDFLPLVDQLAQHIRLGLALATRPLAKFFRPGRIELHGDEGVHAYYG